MTLKPFALKSLPKWRVAWKRMRSYWGLCDGANREIALHPVLLDHPDSLLNTVIHEAVHAVDDELAEVRAEMTAAVVMEIMRRIWPQKEEE